MTLQRRQLEIQLLGSKYGRIECGPNVDWILFKEFPLPEGWNRATTELLVLIPAGYPATAPDNFYVRDGLRLANGTMPRNYSEGQNILGGKWAQFSLHAESWISSSVPKNGDNLLTFTLAMVRRLREGA